VVVGANSVIEGHCEIGYPTELAKHEPLIVGRNALIRSHSVFYQGSVLGDNLVTGHRVTVREFTRAGKNLQIGTLSDLQGDCEIGDYVRTHSSVHIGKLSRIGSFVWIYPYVVLTNDPRPPSNYFVGVTVGNYAVIATMSVILPGITIGQGSLVGAHSLVNKDVPEEMVVGGSPARIICEIKQLQLVDGSGNPAYPWRSHFHRGFPPDVVEQWVKESNQTD
jgi:acetyltransferase-like isoleucine patch superfamily enzyme